MYSPLALMFFINSTLHFYMLLVDDTGILYSPTYGLPVANHKTFLFLVHGLARWTNAIVIKNFFVKK